MTNLHHKIFHTEPRVPSWEEWDPSGAMLQKHLIDVVLSPTMTVRLCCRMCCDDDDESSGGSVIPKIGSGMILLLFWCMCFPPLLLLYLQAPIWHVCITSGSYLVWRELLALPLRRPFLQNTFSEETITATASYQIRTGSGGSKKQIKDLLWYFEIPRALLCRSAVEDADYPASLPMEVEEFCRYFGELDKEGHRLDENGDSIQDGDTLDIKIRKDDLDRAREYVRYNSNDIRCTVVPEYVLKNEVERISCVPKKFVQSLLFGLFRMIVGTVVYTATVGHLLVYCLFKVYAPDKTISFCDPLSRGHTSVYSVWSVALCGHDELSMNAVLKYFGVLGVIFLGMSAYFVISELLDKRIRGTKIAKLRQSKMDGNAA